MSIVSYSQNFEDVLLWRALKDVQQGRYLDIGAHDPVIDSVSLLFYEAGWRGMHVEPVPQYATRLREARVDEPVVEAAVTDAPGPMLFHELSGLSTGRKDIADHHARMGHEARQMLVPTVRLEQCMTVLGRDIHWCKIDVEGMEGDVLRSWGDCDIRPWVLLIESTFPNTQERTQDEWLPEVLGRGYQQVFFDGLSCYFVHEAHPELVERFAGPANVFDEFAITRNHFSAGRLSGEVDAAKRAAGELEVQLADAKAALQASADRNRQLTEDQRQMGEQLARSEKGNAEAAHLLEEAKRAAATALADVARLSERSAQLEDKVARADEERVRAEALFGAAQGELGAAQGELGAAQGELGAVRGELGAVRGQLGAAQGELGAVQGELGAAVSQLSALRAELASERAASAGLNSRLDYVYSLAQRIHSGSGDNWTRLGRALGFASRQSSLQPIMDLFAAFGGSEGVENKLELKGLDGMASLTAHQDRNPYLRANSLDELLAWSDVNFVRCAYVTVLGRQPDEDGETYYTNRIRQGHSKLEVLWQLRKSPEGSDHDPGIAGFDRALRRYRRSRMPLLGGLLRLFNSQEGDSGADRRQRAMANELAVLLDAHRAQVQALHDLSAAVQRVEERTENGLASVPVAFSQPSLIGPIDLSAANSPEDVIDILKTSINQSREVSAFRSESRASS